jgi:hypothetical protein|nr:MAG TPA: RteC protein [Caudoviricetes sp.]
MLQNTDKTRQRYETSTTPPNEKQRYQLTGTYTDLAEVVKGLFEAGILQGNQSDFFNDLCSLLQVKQTNLKDLLKGIIRRKERKLNDIGTKISIALILWKARLETDNKMRKKEKIRVKKLGFLID